MTSSASSVNDALAAYLAGRTPAEKVVAVVAAEYYGEGERGKREGLKPIVDVIEKAHPGVVELSSSADRPGFAVRLAERPFPKRFEDELRRAVASVGTAVTLSPSPVPLPPSSRRPGLLRRIVNAIRKVFSA